MIGPKTAKFLLLAPLQVNCACAPIQWTTYSPEKKIIIHHYIDGGFLPIWTNKISYILHSNERGPLKYHTQYTYMARTLKAPNHQSRARHSAKWPCGLFGRRRNNFHNLLI